MLGYLRFFSTSFIVAVILWSFISMVLTIPILAGMYHRHHRLRPLAFLFYETWIPARHHGQTLDAMFTHMSVATRARKPFAHVVFYLVRTMVLYSLVGVGIDLPFWYRPALVMGSIVFWFAAHAMPYDLIRGRQQSNNSSRSVNGTGDAYHG